LYAKRESTKAKQKPNKSKFNNNRKNCPTKPQAGRYKNKFKGKHRITWLGH